MLIHHMATCFLIFGSAYSNFIGIGAIVAWIHLVTDIPASLVKCLVSTHYGKMTLCAYTMVMLSWGYLRLICESFWIYNIFTHPVMGYPGDLAKYNIYITLNGVYLSILQCLQFYWYFLLIKMLVSYKKKGVTEDLQNKV